MYTDLGFDKLLNRRNAPSSMMDDATSRYITSLSGSNISGGITSSNTGTLSINWDTGEIKINDGARSRVLLGYVAEEDTYGIKILNNLGEVVFSVAGQVGTGGIEDEAVTDAKITSLSANKILAGELIVPVDLGTLGSGYIRLDGENNRIIINDGTNDIILLGYQAGGF